MEHEDFILLIEKIVLRVRERSRDVGNDSMGYMECKEVVSF